MCHCVLIIGCLIMACIHKTLCKCATINQGNRYKPSHYCLQYYVHGMKKTSVRIGVNQLRYVSILFRHLTSAKTKVQSSFRDYHSLCHPNFFIAYSLTQTLLWVMWSIAVTIVTDPSVLQLEVACTKATNTLFNVITLLAMHWKQKLAKDLCTALDSPCQWYDSVLCDIVLEGGLSIIHSHPFPFNKLPPCY